ncbi:MAG: hypothetical protein N3E51_01415 [Candidatus Micrarchaeota archaeon]|nr:hypothetical protein [Candidatus Micrarchaeota archaeon]
MESYLAVLMLLLRLANIVVAAYLIYFAFLMSRMPSISSFSRTIRLLLLAIVLFFIVEVMYVFRLIPQDSASILPSLFEFVFLLLLISVLHEVRKGMLAHDHLMQKRARQRLVDVE